MNAVFLLLLPVAHSIALRAAWGRAIGVVGPVVHHIVEPHQLQATTLDRLTNVAIPSDEGRSVLAFAARPADESAGPRPVLVLLHEFFGLRESVVDKAQGLADELGCLVVAPDVFRGVTTDFIPRAIWLALSTPQPRVNADIDAVLRWAAAQDDCDAERVAVMGFCFGGGKAIGYTTQARRDAATVVFYGAPVTDVASLRGLASPVCGCYGADDAQFPQFVVDGFRDALEEAGVEHTVVSYDGVGHAFWKDMAQIARQEAPQTEAWQLATGFLRAFFERKQASVGEAEG